ncbi:MAG TPA: F0F1 ATP synthase subunit B [Bacteroidales bacterium]|nr:F0F1 ATP synthase subunit B [Bacteroidales bacterium]HSA44506.1 F0F1 ATP synthase subunit B [Bacteroidales bacterium]
MELVSPGIGLIFWMTLSFGLVLFLLRKFAWKPIMKALHEREANIDAAIHAADKAREEMEALKFSNEQLLREAKEERDALLRDARKVREAMLEDAKSRAKEEAERILESARAGIEFEKMAAMTDLQNQLAQLSIEIAEKILREELSDKHRQEAFISRLMKDIKIN